MNLVENIREGLRSINANLLRSILTALIVAIGITSLVGILTAIDGIQNSVNDNLSELGVNTFRIYSKRNRNSQAQGVAAKTYPILKYKEVTEFEERYYYPSNISVYCSVTGTAEIKRLSEKTNPNVWVQGASQDYVILKGLNIEEGRNFSTLDNRYGTNVVIIGQDIRKVLFEDNENVIGEEISVLGQKFRVIGLLEEKGQASGQSYDNSVIIPLISANKLSGGRRLFYEISIGIDQSQNINQAMGEATGLMRLIRRDRLGDEHSFEIQKSESLTEQVSRVTSILRIAGFLIGFVALLGASIALMNIMMVSVTERTREVGIRKALGATQLRIKQQFIIEAIVVCLIGGLAGILFGIGIGNFVSRILDIPGIVIPWGWMLFGIVLCVIVGLVSGYYPASKAAKLDPIDSLRFE